MLVTLEWEAARWDVREVASSVITTPLSQGRRAYAAKQAYVRRKLKDGFAQLWGKPLGADDDHSHDDEADLSDVLEDSDCSSSDYSSEDD